MTILCCRFASSRPCLHELSSDRQQRQHYSKVLSVCTMQLLPVTGSDFCRQLRGLTRPQFRAEFSSFITRMTLTWRITNFNYTNMYNSLISIKVNFHFFLLRNLPVLHLNRRPLFFEGKNVSICCKLSPRYKLQYLPRTRYVNFVTLTFDLLTLKFHCGRTIRMH